MGPPFLGPFCESWYVPNVVNVFGVVLRQNVDKEKINAHNFGTVSPI